MRVAVVGGGAAGIAAAWRLSGFAEVTLFEADRRLGGHADTHAVMTGGRTYSLDSGFTLFNSEHYPVFSAWLDELGVATQEAEASFSVVNPESGLEYGSRSLSSLFCQRRNLLSIRFWRMLGDLFAFSARLEQLADAEMSLAELIEAEGYSSAFVDDHLLPLCGSVWSLPPRQVLEVGVGHVVRHMAQRRLLPIGGAGGWRVVSGGSQRYVSEFERRFAGTVRRGVAVRRVERGPSGVQVIADGGAERFDLVVFACHSDQALALLGDPSRAEREVLGAIRYRSNRVVVHSDASVMPENRSAWSSCNALSGDGGQVTYWVNLLQSLSSPEDFFVTVNPSRRLRRVWSERSYEHPQLDAAARRAQLRHGEISGVRNTFYCGAYWASGSHEDAFASGIEVAGRAREVLSIAA